MVRPLIFLAISLFVGFTSLYALKNNDISLLVMTSLITDFALLYVLYKRRDNNPKN